MANRVVYLELFDPDVHYVHIKAMLLMLFICDHGQMHRVTDVGIKSTNR